MKDKKDLIQHIAPTLASALAGPFTGVATKFITDNLVKNSPSSVPPPEESIKDLLNDSHNLQKIKALDQQFELEMQKLDVDIFSLETNDTKDAECNAKTNNQKPQVILSILFLVAYFLMLVAIFAVETSDTLNMAKGGNSLMGELQILFGVLTAGVGQILSFWFGGVFSKK